MNCEHCKELLHGHDAELSAHLQAELAAHLKTCADCARVSTSLHTLDTLLDTELTPSPGLRRQVLARLEQEATQHKAPATAFTTMSVAPKWFMQLWPSRPLGAFSYSLVLVLAGMFSGQLLPMNAADTPADNVYQLCPVPDGPRATL